MLSGQPPFSADDPMDIYPMIIKNQPVYPPKFSKSAKSLISQLLVANPTERLGSMRAKSKDVTGHSFFGSLDWAKLVARQLTAPFVPVIKSRSDTSNFESIEEEDASDDFSKYLKGKESLFEEF